MNPNHIHSVYFIGIGGIGMSALARWFHARGIRIAGYDRVNTPLIQQLIEEGIEVHFEDNPALIAPTFFNKASTLIVYTPAVPSEHAELSYFRSRRFDIMKRSEVLGLISKRHFTIAVAGTHGKTTTSSMIAHLMNTAPGACSAFVGGIMTNYDSNLMIGGEDAPVVAEADEFDRSFLALSPDYSILTSLDPDHLDVYGDEETMEKTYLKFLKLNDKKAKLLLHTDTVEQLGSELAGLSYRSFGLGRGEIQAANLKVEDGLNVFDYCGETTIKGLRLALPGYHNVSNALSAITAALDRGLSPDTIKARMAGYRGVRRRFEYHIKTSESVYIDDYAHHPSEIKALISSVRFLYPDKRITVIFQPHLFTRTRDFREGFVKSLSLADEVLMLPIYPARELPIPGVTSTMLLDDITCRKKSVEMSDFPHIIDDRRTGVLLTVGAGDIDRLVPVIAQHLQHLKEEPA